MKLLALMKKEFLRFFRDPKLIFTMIFPGLLIYAIYSILGGVMWDKEKTYDFRAAAVSMPPSFEELLQTAANESEGVTLTFEKTEEKDAAKKKVESGELTALIVFPANFEEEIKTPHVGESAPMVEIYYRSADEESGAFYNFASAVLNAFESAQTNLFDINAGEGYDLSGEGSIFASVMGSVLPFIVVALVFSSCMSVTLESVAGEKERGTLATILVTSVKRTHVALGKVLPLACVALIGAFSSFLGIALSMPKLVGVSVGAFAGSYGFLSYFMLLLLIFSIVPLIVTMISAVSAYSKSVKEATAYTSVIMVFVMVISLVSCFLEGVGGWVCVIPILNAVISMQGVLAMNFAVWQALVSAGLNIVYTGALVLLIAKMLSSEKIMFGK